MAQDADNENNVRGKLGRISQAASAAWGQASEKGQTIYKSATEQAGQFSDQYRNSRAREYVEAVMKQAGQGLDTISGRAMYELVRDRLDLQDRYNDLLATKLQDALDRIEALEKLLAKREQGGRRGDDA